jgi:hypothetical protein
VSPRERCSAARPANGSAGRASIVGAAYGPSSACRSGAGARTSSQSASCSGRKITGIRSRMGAVSSFGTVVTMAKRHRLAPDGSACGAAIPAKANSVWSVGRIGSGCFCLPTVCHSKQCVAGIGHGVWRNAVRNVGDAGAAAHRSLNPSL